MRRATTTAKVLGKKLREEREYWISKWDPRLMESAPLAPDFEPAAAKRRTGRVEIPFDPDTCRKLDALTGQGPFLICTTLTAVVRICLYRYTGKASQVIGSPAQKEEGDGSQAPNALPIVDRVREEASFQDFLLQVRQTLLEAYRNQHYPVRRLLQDLGLKPEAGHCPLFDAALLLEGFQAGLAELGNDLTFCFRHQSGHLQGTLQFDRNRFREERIERLALHLACLLRAALKDTARMICTLPMLTGPERELLERSNESAFPPPRQETLLELLDEELADRSDRAALTFGPAVLSYGELDRQADSLAGRLREAGAEPDRVVGICLERSLNMMVGIMGILKAGSAYLPLDPKHPPERLSFMLRDAAAAALLSLEKHRRLLPQGPHRTLLLDRQATGPSKPGPPPAAHNLAYVIYTSGSTGRPKGVLVSHGNLLHSTQARDLYYRQPVERFLLVSPYIFDSSAVGIFSTLCQGGCLVLAEPGMERDPFKLLPELALRSITHILCLPTLYGLLLKESRPRQMASLQIVMVAGEACPRSLIDRHHQLMPNTGLFDEYGPSEAAVWSSVHQCRADDEGEAVPIGLPVPRTRLHVLGPALARMPLEASGELCIAGPGLARGYLARPSLTAQAFVPDPFSPQPGQRLYRTGDLVRRRPDGALDFLGRIDRQVKIRGHRVEIEEVEALLASHPDVREAAVAARSFNEGDTRLLAFLVAGSADQDRQERDPLTEQDGLQGEYISQTRAIYDEIYRQAPSSAGQINLRAWISSYTGQPLTEEEILETVDDLSQRILALQPRRVLEVGTGTGLILFRVAPHCRRYHATDISRTSIDFLRKELMSVNPPLQGVTLEQGAAHELDGLAEGAYDAVVLSFVTQHFPSAGYLADFLENAVRLVAPGGFIYLGGIRSLPLLETFHASVQMHLASDPSLPRQQLRHRIQERLSSEGELAIDPAFFTAFQQHCKRVSHAQAFPRGGRFDNEITRFQYDAVLHIESDAPTQQASWRNWRREGMTLAELGRRLDEQRPKILGFSQLPNARLARDVRSVEILHSGPDSETLHEIRQALQQPLPPGAVDPSDLQNLAQEKGYQLELSWAGGASDGSFDAALTRLQAGRQRPPIQPRWMAQPRPWAAFTNNPLQGLYAGELSPRLRSHLRERLPEHCLPSAFLYLQELPCTPNGKLDRRALHEMARMPSGTVGALSAPQTPAQKELAEIWCDVLGIARAGLDDDFFDLGGHSLLATQVLSGIRRSLGVELDLDSLFAAPTLAAMAQRIEEARQAPQQGIPPILPVSRQQEIPLSFAQQRLWFLAQLEPDSALYHIPSLLRLEGALDKAALQASLAEIVRRHEALRTVFPAPQGQPVQQILPAGSFSLQLADLADSPSTAQQDELSRLGQEWVRRPFDLSKGPLLRVLLLRLAPRDHVLAVVMHHIIADGWSMGILVQELTELYQAYSSQRPSPLPDLPLQYADFAHWQRQWLSGQVLNEQKEYWRKRLKGAPPLLNLPADRPRPLLRSRRGSTESFLLPGSLSDQWKSLSRRSEATLFMSLLAAFQLLLSRLSGQRDLSVGTLIANRNRSETERLIGFFVNTLVLRSQISAHAGFDELLGQVRQSSLQAFAHQDVPFEQVVEDLHPQRSLSHAPLFQVMFVLQNIPISSLQLAGLEATLAPPAALLAEFDLSLLAAEGPQGIEGMIEYSQDLFDRTTIRRVVGSLETLMREIAAAPWRPVFELPLLGASERQQMLLDWNDTRSAYSRDCCVHQLFEAQAQRRPEASAAELEGQELTYRELDRRANQLASQLRSNGAAPETLVGLCLEAGLETLVGLLGILKSGAGYVPLDPGFPPDRLAFMMEDAQVPLLVTQEALLIGLPGQALPVCLDADSLLLAEQPDQRVAGGAGPHNLVYVIYTSGSTGQPKGVVIRHGPLVNYVEHIAAEYGLAEGDRVLQYGSVSFDVAGEEIYPCLARGGTLVLRSPEMLGSTSRFLEICRQSRLNLLNLPTAYWHQLTVDLDLEKAALPEALRMLVIGGERALPSHLELWRRQVGQHPRLVNAYGPTESTIGATLFHLPSSLPSSGREVPIGRPNRNTRVYLLDGDLQPVPIGVAAEVFIAGAGVAQGYLNRPSLTAERFIPEPFSSAAGQRMYRSGDLAGWLTDGSLEFLGRTDHQVKLRGFRIEIGEIESALSRHPAVSDAAVLVREDVPGQKRLVAYLASEADPPPPTMALQIFLRQFLPEHMVPPLFVVLKELPLTPGGKVDRKALPEEAFAEAETGFVPPSTPAEELLAGIWANLLHLEKVGSQDNFFDLGGHSLLATQMISRIRQALDVELPLWELFEARTLADLARRVEQLRLGPDSSVPAIEPLSREQELPLSFAQQRMWFMDQLMPGSSINNIPMSARLQGDLNLPALQATLGQIAQRHEVLRTTYPVVKGKPFQLIHPAMEWRLGIADLSALHNREELAESLTRQEARRPFDLAAGPLFRTHLLRLDPRQHVLLVTLHHIVSDGWSTGVLTRELTELYQAFCAGRPSPLPDLPIQFADFAHWQRQWLSGAVLEEQINYWESRLAEPLPVLQLPIDRPRPSRETYRGGTESFLASSEVLQAFRQLSRQEEATLYMALLAAYQTFLYRITGQQDILVGSPVTNRNRPETEQLIGFFSNTLVMRTDLSGNPSFRQLLRRVRQLALGAYAHQDLPFERLVEALRPERSLSHSPLFQVLFTFQNAQDHLLELPGLTLSLGSQADIGAAKCDLTLIMTEAIRLGGLWVYNSDLFETAAIQRLSTQFQTLLSSIVAQPDASLDQLDMMTEVERSNLVKQRKERQKSKFDKLLSIQSKGVSLKKKEVIRTRLVQPGERLPVVIEPAVDDVDLSDWARNQIDFIEGKLFEHGAILFRGFHIDSVADFECFVKTVCPDLRIDYGDLPPEQGSRTIYRSTPYPQDKMILFHNESSHLDSWPLKQFFCCLKVAKAGGETPLADCRKIYRLLSRSTRRKLEEKKLMYVRNFTSGLDVSWQDFFKTEDKGQVEQQCREAGMTFSWREDGGLQTRKVCPAVARHPRTGETMFFNQIELHHPFFLDPEDRKALQSIFDEDRFPRTVYYGDGRPIEEGILREVQQAFEQASVANPWQPGDLIMLDNMLTAHARNPYQGERKVVVAMGQVTTERDLQAAGNRV